MSRRSSRSPQETESAANNVTFSSLSQQQQQQQHGETSSQASSSKTSSTRERQSQEITAGSSPGASSSASRERTSGDHGRHGNRRSRGFLLDSAFGLGHGHGHGHASESNSTVDRHGKRRAEDGYLHVNKRRPANPRLSVDSSVRSSPLSREIRMNDGQWDDDGEARKGEGAPRQMPRPASMDPAQLVQMALSLSESRRRHVSGPLQVPLGSPRDDRRASGLSPAGLVARSGTNGRQRASFASADAPRDSPLSQRSVRDEEEQQDTSALDASAGRLEDVPSSFSEATISRAEKARLYFELASQHRRLLRHLPPLLTDDSAPGNYHLVASASPGSPLTDLKRVPSYANNKHALGRAYNPLQALRNRRLRARERRSLPAPPASWTDSEKIKEWIDGVEAATREPSFRPAPDRVLLPPYEGEADHPVELREQTKGHRRTDTASSVIIKPENGWCIEPPELLADTYWTEQADNKASIENRFGNPLCPSLACVSVDRSRRSHSFDDERRGSKDDASSVKRGKRASNIWTMRRRRLNRSPSTTSGSSAEGRAPPAPRYDDHDGGDENLGPLDRHMQELIAREERGELTSPDVDHWEHAQFASVRGHKGHGHRDTHSHDQGGLSVASVPQHRRAKSADGRVYGNDHLLDSGEDLAATRIPTSETAFLHNKEIISDQAHTSPQKSKLRHLPFLRSHSKERNGTDRTDFAVTNDFRPNDSRSSQESTRPSFISRHKTIDSVSNGLRRQGTNSTVSTLNGKEKESSGVGRFFKGGRIGDLMRTESSRKVPRHGKDNTEAVGSRSDSDNFSTVSEEDDERHAGGMPIIVADDDDEASPRTSIERGRKKPKYHMQNLPSFVSPSRNDTGTPEPTDPIARQQEERRRAGRSPRFDRLAPPRIDPPTDDSAALDPEFSTYDSNAFERRKSYGFLGIDAQATSRTSLAQPDDGSHHRRSAYSRAGPGGRRHWSISDQTRPPQTTTTRVSTRDIARVRALLLSSGIKAREITLKALSPRPHPLPVYQATAHLLGEDFTSVPVKEEHLLASRLLSTHLTTSLQNLESSISAFSTGPAATLARELEGLQTKVADHLTQLVHETSDEADAFVVELTTKQPQDVKRVDDAIDDLLRQRRRQWRLVRRAGFKVLEWAVLGVLWGVWFVVVIFNLAKRFLGAGWRVGRWLVWF